MARTRSKPASKAKAKESTPEPTTSNAKPLPDGTSNPPKVFILPKDASKDARIVTLDNPADETPSRYFFCPQKGFYEFTRIAAPKKDYKSWLITGDRNGGEGEAEQERNEELGSGYITKSADMFIATPIDLLFLILPALAPKSAKDTKQHFLAIDDYFDALSTSSRHWRALMSQYPSLKTSIEKKMRTICDTVDAGDETMYRLSHEKLLAKLLQKAKRMSSSGLPASLEEKFIKPALDIPVMIIKRSESTLCGAADDTTITTTQTDSQSSTTATDSATPSQPESQSSASTSLTTPDTDALPPPPQLTTPPEVPALLRLRTSLTYLQKTYIPATLQTPLSTLLSTPSSIVPDFTPLTAHLATLAALRSEAAALRSISDNISRKRAIEEDEEKIAEREEKKRKKEEEDKKKKSEGRGIKQLKKVDTSGMKKMSAFFTKVPKKA